MAMLCPFGSPKIICVMKKNEKSLQEFLPQLINAKQQKQLKGGEDIVIQDMMEN